MLNEKKMTGRVPLENVSERKNKMNARGSDDEINALPEK
jgi:hypothetical protein